MIKISKEKLHILSLNAYFLGDHCQYWLNKEDGTLTSPNFGTNDLGQYQLHHSYGNNLNCTWILNADPGYYITLEIEYFDVNNNNNYHIIDIYFLYL